MAEKKEVFMKIDNLGNISNYSNISSERAVKKNVNEEKTANSTDRVEIGLRTTTEEASAQIKDNIIKAEKQKISSERLDAIKNKIRNNEYHVDTEEIVKSII